MPILNLHQSAMGDDLQAVSRALAAGADVNARDEFGVTALHYAAAVGAVEVMLSLLRAGADANARDVDGNTPLHAAALQNKRFEPIAVLLWFGADSAAQNSAKQTAYDMALEAGHQEVITLLAPGKRAAAAVDKARAPAQGAQGSRILSGDAALAWLERAGLITRRATDPVTYAKRGDAAWSDFMDQPGSPLLGFVVRAQYEGTSVDPAPIIVVRDAEEAAPPAGADVPAGGSSGSTQASAASSGSGLDTPTKLPEPPEPRINEPSEDAPEEEQDRPFAAAKPKASDDDDDDEPASGDNTPADAPSGEAEEMRRFRDSLEGMSYAGLTDREAQLDQAVKSLRAKVRTQRDSEELARLSDMLIMVRSACMDRPEFARQAQRQRD